MLCHNLQEIIGFECVPLDEHGKIARIFSPFSFDDGDPLPIYIESYGNKIRFFDDGGVLMHFLGRGVTFDSGHKTRFIKNAADSHGLSLTEDGDVEIWSNIDEASSAFSNYVQTLLKITNWEHEHRGVATDLSFFIEEVAFCLMAWKPTAVLVKNPEYTGISNQKHKLDFKLNETGIITVSSNSHAVSAAIKKLLDIKAGSQTDLEMMVIIDDRVDKDAANRESLIIQSVAKVLTFTRLEKNAHKANAATN